MKFYTKFIKPFMAILLFINPLLHGMGSARSMPVKFGPSRALSAQVAARYPKVVLPANNRINPSLLPSHHFLTPLNTSMLPKKTQSTGNFKKFDTKFQNFTQKPPFFAKSRRAAATGIAGGVSLATILMIKAELEKEIETLQNDIQQDKAALEKLESTELKTDQNKSDCKELSHKKAELEKTITVKQHLLAFAQKVLILLTQYSIMLLLGSATMSPLGYISARLYTTFFIEKVLTPFALYLVKQCGSTNTKDIQASPTVDYSLYGGIMWFSRNIVLPITIDVAITNPTMNIVGDFIQPVTTPLAHVASAYVAAPLSSAAHSVYTHAGPITREIYSDMGNMAVAAKKFSGF